VLFRQFVDDDLGCASYLIGDEEAHEAVVVDPAYEVEQYLETAEQHGVEITRVLETHTHADHVSGHGRFALEHGVPAGVHPAAEPEYPFEPLEDGMEIPAGRVCLRVLHTPGHRPEHCCFVVTDLSRADEPWLVLTGDSLFVGDTARPDLAVEAREGAEDLFQSLGRLLELADGVEVFPGHVAGSLCGVGMSSKASSTIGFERRFNPALALGSVQEFVSETAHVATPRPPTMERVVAINRGPFVGRPAPLEPLAEPGEATVLDVRPARGFAAGHVPGAVNVPVSGSSFGTRAGFVLPPDGPVAIHAGDASEAEEAARRLRAVGFLELDGYLAEPPVTATLDPVSLDELEEMLAEEAVELIDVREPSERDSGFIPGSRNIPYRAVRAFAEELGGGPPVVTICETGTRAGIAASVLAAAGVEARPVLDGGVPNWRAAGKQTTEFRRCGA
jgi:glyoxylase-like metal-dependent hydrolase (beta-lactamase superfamily II)/rhodanese-related sulfurtransferase